MLLTACATTIAAPGLHLDLRTFQGPLRAGTPTEVRLERTCAQAFHVNVTDDEHQPAPGVPVHFELDSVERCMEETVAQHTLSTEPVTSDPGGVAVSCDPVTVSRDDPWRGIEGCSSVFGEVRLVVGTGSKQVVKLKPFTDGMTVALRHGHDNQGSSMNISPAK